MIKTMNNFFIFFTVMLVIQIQAEKRLRFTIKESNLWSDNNILNYTELFDESEPSFNFQFKVMKRIPDVDVHVEGYLRHKDNYKYYAQFNGTYSLCRVFAFKNASPLAGLIFNHLKSFGNIPDNCPIKEDTYGLKKLWFGDHAAKLNLSEAEINVHIQAFAVNNNEIVKILDNTYKAETIYKEILGEVRKAGGLLSMLG